MTQTQLFAFRYDDTDTIMNELDEFYPYIEIGHVAQNASRFAGSFDGGGYRRPSGPELTQQNGRRRAWPSAAHMSRRSSSTSRVP